MAQQRGRIALWVVAAVVGIVALLLGVAFYPMFHNRYVFPLGRLYGSVSKGEPYEEVRAKFTSYYEARKDGGEVQFNEQVVESDLLRTKQIPPSRMLSLYDLSAFDDVQLQVLFDAQGRVDEVLFIGD
jgi:hypothetical protein